MASILVVCTGNVCRSPIAEGALRAALRERLGEAAPEVSSAGTAGWEGSGAMPESVEAAAERGLDISGHAARRLVPDQIRSADLLVALAAEHREEVVRLVPEAVGRTFTLKEVVRLLEALPAADAERSGDVGGSVAEADALRRSGFRGNPWDEDVVDPLGLPLTTYRAVAWEIDEWCRRLADLLAGRTRPRSLVAPEEE
jgi:protein-tyrosine phosphatase